MKASGLPINAARIAADIDAIASFSEAPPEVGYSRPTFSEPWRRATEYVIAQATAAGCKYRIDAAGNVHIRPAAVAWETKVWLSGSHLDSVPSGGKYDGVVGVVVPLEILRAAFDHGRHDLPLELICFAEEEGTTFGIGMIGSRLWTGTPAGHFEKFKNHDGKTFIEAGASFGVDSSRLWQDQIQAPAYHGFVEIHVEQGPAMWDEQTQLAVVGVIAGRRQYTIEFASPPNHAGSTPMRYRADPLVAAAEMIVGIEKWARENEGQAVATVGRVECEPNAINIIPGRVRFTLDVRSPQEQLLEVFDGVLKQAVASGTPRHRFVTPSEAIRPIEMDAALCRRLQSAGNLSLPTNTSGALHDAAVIAKILPTAMLFIASQNGISHNPAEFSRIEDIAAAGLLLSVMIDDAEYDGRERFVARYGSLFEHSPWIANETYARQPFADTRALHAALCVTLRLADDKKKTELINAHPDLVGRLAREGKLTRDSTAEQAAAGLDQLNDDEIAAFERYNAAYREKFGFPFVICARLNKKDAILTAFPKRLANSRDEEIRTALAEIEKIAWLRLEALENDTK